MPRRKERGGGKQKQRRSHKGDDEQHSPSGSSDSEADQRASMSSTSSSAYSDDSASSEQEEETTGGESEHQRRKHSRKEKEKAKGKHHHNHHHRRRGDRNKKRQSSSSSSEPSDDDEETESEEHTSDSYSEPDERSKRKSRKQNPKKHGRKNTESRNNVSGKRPAPKKKGELVGRSIPVFSEEPPPLNESLSPQTKKKNSSKENFSSFPAYMYEDTQSTSGKYYPLPFQHEQQDRKPDGAVSTKEFSQHVESPQEQQHANEEVPLSEAKLEELKKQVESLQQEARAKDDLIEALQQEPATAESGHTEPIQQSNEHVGVPQPGPLPQQNVPPANANPYPHGYPSYGAYGDTYQNEYGIYSQVNAGNAVPANHPEPSHYPGDPENRYANTNYEDLMQRLEETENAAATSETQVMSLERQLEAMKTENRMLQQQYEELKNNQSKSSGYSAEEVQHLHQQIQQLETELAKLRNERRQEAYHQKQLQNQVEDANQRYNMVQDHVNLLQDENQQLRSQLQGLTHKNHKLQQDYDRHRVTQSQQVPAGYSAPSGLPSSPSRSYQHLGPFGSENSISNSDSAANYVPGSNPVLPGYSSQNFSSGSNPPITNQFNGTSFGQPTHHQFPASSQFNGPSYGLGSSSQPTRNQFTGISENRKSSDFGWRSNSAQPPASDFSGLADNHRNASKFAHGPPYGTTQTANPYPNGSYQGSGQTLSGAAKSHIFQGRPQSTDTNTHANEGGLAANRSTASIRSSQSSIPTLSLEDQNFGPNSGPPSSPSALADQLRTLQNQARARENDRKKKKEQEVEINSRQRAAPFATDASSQAHREEASCKERELLNLNLEKNQLSGELDKLGPGEPRTIDKRKKKKEYENRLDEVEKQLSHVRSWLRKYEIQQHT